MHLPGVPAGSIDAPEIDVVSIVQCSEAACKIRVVEEIEKLAAELEAVWIGLLLGTGIRTAHRVNEFLNTGLPRLIVSDLLLVKTLVFGEFLLRTSFVAHTT